MTNKSNINLRRLCFTAMLVAMALVMRLYFSVSLPVMGENGMRVGFGGIFTGLSAILFGPLWGSIAGGLTDVFGYLLRPEGAYLYHLTLTAIGAGFLRGIIWVKLRNKAPSNIRKCLIAFSLILLGFGIFSLIAFAHNSITVNFFNENYVIDTSGMLFISRFVIARSEVVANPTNTLQTMISTFTITPIVSGALGIFLVVADFLLSKFFSKDGKEYVNLMPIIIAMLVAAWFQNTVNTFVLRTHTFSSWQLLPIWMVWFPRIVGVTISAIIHTYFVALLFNVFKKQKYLRPYLR